uniref:Uncharacterized protein n=1 Tax=Tetranychus urticae TaxID=32264 RepID=T1KTT2_TETUR
MSTSVCEQYVDGLNASLHDTMRFVRAVLVQETKFLDYLLQFD